MTQALKKTAILPSSQSFLTNSNSFNGSTRFKLLTIPLALTVSLCAGMAWYVWDSYNAIKKIQTQDLRIQKLSGDITYLDEVLTSSARLSATTDSKRWKERYLSYVPKLDTALAEAQKLLPNVFKSDAFIKTNAANEKLVALETRAFELVNKGNQKAATALLLGAEYEGGAKSNIFSRVGRSNHCFTEVCRCKHPIKISAGIYSDRTAFNHFSGSATKVMMHCNSG